MSVELRAVERQDLASTRKLVDDAFRPADAVTFLDSLRADGCILVEWLAEDSSGPLGHIVFSRAWVEPPNGERAKAAMLTPLAVCPDRQRVGIGSRLMDFAPTHCNGAQLGELNAP
jgi:predicted N-acetyltransferase YhbS